MKYKIMTDKTLAELGQWINCPSCNSTIRSGIIACPNCNTIIEQEDVLEKCHMATVIEATLKLMRETIDTATDYHECMDTIKAAAEILNSGGIETDKEEETSGGEEAIDAIMKEVAQWRRNPCPNCGGMDWKAVTFHCSCGVRIALSEATR